MATNRSWWERASQGDLAWNWIWWLIKPWVAPVLATAGVVYLAMLDHLRPWNVAVAGIWALAGMVALLVYAARLRAVMQAGPTVTSENVEAVVRDWIDRAGLAVKRVDDRNAVFNFEITLASGAPVNIARPKVRTHLLIVKSGVSVTGRDLEVLRAQDPARVDRLLLDLKIELNRLSMSYEGMKMPLDAVFVSRQVLIGSALNDVELFRVVDEVIHSVYLMKHIMAMRFGEWIGQA